MELEGITTCPICGAVTTPDTGIAFGKKIVCTDCKDAYSQAMREGGATGHFHHEALRQKYLRHENGLRLVFYLYLVPELTLMGIGAAVLFTPLFEWPYRIMLGLFFLLVGIGWALIGLGFRKLQPRVRTPATVIAIFGLILFPIGTVINALILWLMHCEKGRMVFSEEYAAVIDATPDMSSKQTKTLWIVLASIIGFLIMVLIAVSTMAPFIFFQE